jgi:hypothetical protein
MFTGKRRTPPPPPFSRPPHQAGWSVLSASAALRSTGNGRLLYRRGRGVHGGAVVILVGGGSAAASTKYRASLATPPKRCRGRCKEAVNEWSKQFTMVSMQRGFQLSNFSSDFLFPNNQPFRVRGLCWCNCNIWGGFNTTIWSGSCGSIVSGKQIPCRPKKAPLLYILTSISESAAIIVFDFVFFDNAVAGPARMRGVWYQTGRFATIYVGSFQSHSTTTQSLPFLSSWLRTMVARPMRTP